MASKLNRLTNVTLRIATLGTRFLFIFFLARFLDAAAVGYYGLFTATVGYCLYFVGLDFYTYTTREIIKTDVANRGHILKQQAALAVALYLLLSPVFYLALQNSNWPDYLILWFVPILVLEHFNQEMTRLMIALSEQLTASLILFVRQGSWALVIVALMMLQAESRNLQAVLVCWAAAGGLAAILGVYKLAKLNLGGWRRPTSWRWIWQGVRISAAFLVATLALRGIQTVDRYWLEALAGIEIVGAYVLLIGVAGTLLVFLDAGVFAYGYPELIRLYKDGQKVAARKLIHNMTMQSLLFIALFSLVSILVLPYLLEWIGNPVYVDAIGYYPWLLAAMCLNALGLIPHYALYAQGFDRSIIISHLVALVVFFISVWVLSSWHPVISVLTGLNISFLVILGWKAWAYVQLSEQVAGRPSA